MNSGAALRRVAVVVPEHAAEAFTALDFADLLTEDSACGGVYSPDPSKGVLVGLWQRSGLGVLTSRSLRAKKPRSPDGWGIGFGGGQSGRDHAL